MMEQDAVVKGNYRYSLSRVWDRTGEKIMWLMLNPSTADHMVDDPTITRLIGFTKSWGFGGFLVGNFYAYRCTDSKLLLKDSDIDYVGPWNLHHISVIGEQVERVIVAPGNCVAKDHYEQVLAYIDPRKLYYLKFTKNGFPQHPLYLKGDLIPKRLFPKAVNWNPPPSPPVPDQSLSPSIPPPPRHPGQSGSVGKSGEKWNELKEYVQGRENFGPEDFRKLYDLIIFHGKKIEELEIRLKEIEKRVGYILEEPNLGKQIEMV